MDEIAQGSPEWFALRCGKATASRIADILAKTKSGYSASRKNYAAQLIAERLTNTVADSYSNAAMQWGTDTEPQARAAYEFHQNVSVSEVGFVDHPQIEMSGASPDGLVADDGLVEIKCPNTSTHIDTLLNGKLADKYIIQMQWQLACTGRQWCDYVSFDPRLPENMQIFMQRIDRDADRIGDIEDEVQTFLNEIDDTVEKLRAQYG